MNYIKILALLFLFSLVSISCDTDNVDDIIDKEGEHNVDITECDSIPVFFIVDVDPQTNDTRVSASVDGGNAPFTFNWSTGETTSSIIVLTSGTYSLTVTDTDECITESQIDVDLGGDPCRFFTGEIIESNFTLVANATGGTLPYTYEWSTGETTMSIPMRNGRDFDVVITDAAGCVINATYSILTDLIGEITISQNSTLTIRARGGVAPYSYLWSTGETTQVINVLDSGIYSVTITDAMGNTFDTQIAVNLNDICSTLELILNYNDYNATATGRGGAAPYTYLWSTGETTSTISTLRGGQFSVTLTDANNCTKTGGF